ncbi:hypothetical protein ACFL5V_05520 [Fibrobacterota bacterium]
MPVWIRYLLERWYIPASLMLACLFIVSFIQKYPSRSSAEFMTKEAAHEETALLNSLEKLRNRRTAAERDTALYDSGNPFRVYRAVKRRKTVAKSKTPAPGRGFKLKGINNEKTAILINNSGLSMVVETGDKIDSAEVISIGPDKVTLKDRGGTFEIHMAD